MPGYENLFVILLVINIITDIIDGFFARILQEQTYS
ncbi:MAG: CDP-alcohol phosphatidyltransferase family protein [Bacteroidales bacterium]